MRIVFFVFALMLISGDRLNAQIIWNKTRPLSFADFRGKPHDSTFVAATFCGIETKVCKRNFWNGRITISVEATFYPDTSWYLPDKIHDLTLRHEQGHFDIAEWFSRKLRKIIDEEIKYVDDYDRVFQSTYDRMYQEYFLTQEKYEKETGCGTELNGQIKWEMIIRSNLKFLEKYKYMGCQKKL